MSDRIHKKIVEAYTPRQAQASKVFCINDSFISGVDIEDFDWNCNMEVKEGVRELSQSFILYTPYAKKSQYWSDVNIFSPLVNQASKERDILTIIDARTEKILQHSEAQRIEHREIIEKCEQLESMLKRQERENVRLCKLLDERFPIERISIISAAMVLSFLMSLMVSTFYGTIIIQPHLSVVGALTFGGIWVLTRLRLAQANSYI